MPPRKPVSSLQDLTFAASSKLVLDMCQHLEDEVSWDTDVDLPFDTDEYKNAVATLRQHLRSFIAPLLWETFFNSVLELYKKNTYVDEITLYSVFVFEGAHFDKLTLPSVPWDMATLCPRRVEFWVGCAAMLPNLIEVDLTYVLCHQVVAAFCQSCTKLQVITLPIRTRKLILDTLLDNCKDLRAIKAGRTLGGIWNLWRTIEDSKIQRALEELKHLERLDFRFFSINTLKNLNTNRTLKLRSLVVSLISTDDMRVVAERCPDLEELCISGFWSGWKWCPLTSSSLTISTLHLRRVCIDLDEFDEFLSTKGIHITELSLDCKLIGTPRSLLAMLSKCPNLVTFVAKNLRGLMPEHLATSHLLHQVSFPNLEHLSIKTSKRVVSDSVRLISLAIKIVEHSQKMSTVLLEVSGYGFPVPNFEEQLEILFSSPMIKTLTKVVLTCSRKIAKISEQLILHVISSCPMMTSLSIPNYCEKCGIHLRRAMKKNNLDLNINFTLI